MMHLDILNLQKVVKTLSLLTFRGEMFMGYSRCWDEANEAALSRQCEKKLSKGGVIDSKSMLGAYYRKPPKNSVYKRYRFLKISY